MPNSHFIIVGESDAVLYEFDSWNGGLLVLLRQFAAYAALDAVEEAAARQTDVFLPKIHRPSCDNVVVSAFLGLSRIRLVLLQDGEPSELLRGFFSEANRICCAYFVNPFRTPNAPLAPGPFRDQLDDLCRVYLSAG